METTNNKSKALETILVLVGALILVYVSTHKNAYLFLALLLIGIGLVSDSLTFLISKAWLKLAEIMGSMMSKILLSVVFSVFLLPIALLYRMRGNDPLQLKKNNDSYFHTRNKTFQPGDLENPW